MGNFSLAPEGKFHYLKKCPLKKKKLSFLTSMTFFVYFSIFFSQLTYIRFWLTTHKIHCFQTFRIVLIKSPLWGNQTFKSPFFYHPLAVLSLPYFLFIESRTKRKLIVHENYWINEIFPFVFSTWFSFCYETWKDLWEPKFILSHPFFFLPLPFLLFLMHFYGRTHIMQFYCICIYIIFNSVGR